MALPTIFPPVGTCVLIDGHSLTPQPVHDRVGMRQGEGRQRRIYTTAPRIASVSFLLNAAKMAEFDAWFEDTLDRGNRQFTVQVGALKSTRLEYWAAQWLEPYTADPIASKQGLWRVSGNLLLTGEPSDTRPDTGAFELDMRMTLGATAALFNANTFELDMSFHLGVVASFMIELPFSLGVLPPPTMELREDGGIELREDGGIEYRERD